jgi:hypothetical protein
MPFYSSVLWRQGVIAEAIENTKYSINVSSVLSGYKAVRMSQILRLLIYKSVNAQARVWMLSRTAAECQLSRYLVRLLFDKRPKNWPPLSTDLKFFISMCWKIRSILLMFTQNCLKKLLTLLPKSCNILYKYNSRHNVKMLSIFF